MSAANDVSRVAFEAWAISENMPITMSQGTIDDLEATSFCWKCWQASRQAALEQAQDACRLPQADSANAAYRAGYDHAASECRNKIKELL